ncbi:MAG: alpha/beta hydrolase [Clostridia bacterium]|nr:alpha/beta hydrolase [Clostridia bacterium]
MFYYEFGKSENPTVVILHRIGMPNVYDKLIDRLKEDCHVLLPHMYGNGEEVNETFDLTNLTYDLTSFIQRFKSSGVTIFGDEMGALVAFSLIKKCPQVFSSCVLSDLDLFLSARRKRRIRRVYKIARLKWRSAARLLSRITKERQGLSEEAFDVSFEYARYTQSDNVDRMLDVFGTKNVNFDALKVGGAVICGGRHSKETKQSAEYIVQANKLFRCVELETKSLLCEEAQYEISKIILQNAVAGKA